ncbi:helix-turn-helix transcriptional regulator [Thetidibacter halocola]|uniref:Helix-turn-helix transcriptional regulator n=1 Tax=Thetidibacter halocola TaxID=2827239 RepID=A0A8J8B7B6_9RHOB|nr:helix-turn-helix transcriptional regulator [Thetidibacter halocola]MBS0124936.1 helix-turn-helix transcriptional regulator [Thetidibacter halocola]
MTQQDFPDHEYLTVRELADLLRLKERKVYDLAASGAVPCSRATGKLLFPAAEIRAWVARAQNGGAAEAGPGPPIVLGSHDPLLDWAIRQSRCGLATYFDGSFDGLDRFLNGEGIAAGLHVQDAASGRWNVPAVEQAAADRNAVLIAFARRSRGLVHRGDGPPLVRLVDVAGRRMVPRQPESGTDRLFRACAAAEGLDLTSVIVTDLARTEDDAVAAVRRGEADVTFGLASVARGYGLEFLPLVQEEFALLIDRRAFFEPPWQALMGFFRGADFAQRATALEGYDISGLGTVLWNA